MRTRDLARLCAVVFLALACLGGDAWAQGRSGGLTEEEQAFQAAEVAFKANRDDEALTLYEKVCNVNPARADAWTRRAVILYKHKRFAEAKAILQRAREVLPGDPGLKGQLGLTLYRLGETASAVRLLEEAVAKLPDAYQLQLQLGQHYVQAGDGEHAVGAFEAYFRTRPDEAAATDSQVRALSGRAYLLARRYPEARSDLEAALRVHPDELSARMALGEAYTALGEWSRGVALLSNLLDVAKQSPVVLRDLATCLHRLHRLPEAEDRALAYTEALPRDAAGFVLLGDVRAERKNADGAIAAWEQARSLDASRSSELLAREGRALLTAHEPQAALRAFEEADRPRAAKETPEARASEVTRLAGMVDAATASGVEATKLAALGKRLARLGDGAEPETRAQAALAAGLAYYGAGDDQQALAQFEAASAATSSAERAKTGLRMVLNRIAGAALARNDLAGARAALARAATLAPDSVVTGRNRGLVLLLDGKPAEAERVLAKVHERVPDDVVVNRLLARAALAQGQRDAALQRYEAAARAAQPIGGDSLAEVYAELGPLYLDGGQLDEAVAALETAAKQASAPAVRAVVSRNLALALLRRGLSRLASQRETDSALSDLGRAAAAKSGLPADQAKAASCALALASLKAGRRLAALETFGHVSAQGGCVLKPPYDKLGTEFFTAYALYRQGGREGGPKRHEQAARAFLHLAPRAPKALGNLLRSMARSSYQLEAVELYARNQRVEAKVALQRAAALPAHNDQTELDHNLAVLELAAGHNETAGQAFEQLGSRPPEALMNLGIVRDRQGRSRQALALYRRALEHGVRTPHLREWIDVKERVFAQGGEAGAEKETP